MENHNPKELELKIFQGENALPILEEVKAVFYPEVIGKQYNGLTDNDKIVLLARPDIAILMNKTKKSLRCSEPLRVEYKKIRESGEPALPLGSRRGALINVSYKIVRESDI